MFFCMSHFAFSADEARTITNTTIKDIKVFLTGAQINRIVKVNVEGGESTLAFEGLSSQIDQGSISVTGTGNAMVMGVSYRLDYLTEKTRSPEMKRLVDSLEILKASLDKITMMENIYNDEIAFLNANKNTAGANTGVNTENLRKVLDYFHNKMIDVRGKLIDVIDQKKKTSERIVKLNQQINDLNGKLKRPTGTILVTVSAKQTTSLDLNLSYYVNGAGWSPLYDLRSDNISSPVKLNYKASVYQTTGEEWNNVKLSLSTANPVLGGNKPELNAWYLNFYQPPMYRGARSEPKLMMKEMDAAVTAAPAMGNMAEQVQVIQNQLETEFEIPLAYSVASDGKPVNVDIQSAQLNGAYAYYATPKLDKDAFLMAAITGWEQLNLLPGKANVYFENSYVGESFIDPGLTEDTFRLSLGRDRRIVIKREQVKELTSTKFIGSNVVKQFVIEISVRNTKKDAVELTLEDQIPVSQNNDIKVTVDNLNNGKLDNETGKVTWKLNVKAGETQKIRLGFTVKYPKGKTIGNL